MQFIDHTSHIFSLTEYQNRPVGYEYSLNEYVVWLDNPSEDRKLSIDMPYIVPLRMVLNKDDKYKDVEILVEGSNYFKILGSKTIQDLIEENKSVFEISIDEDKLTDKLTNDDLLFLDGITSADGINGVLVPFYIYGESSDEGTFMTNILIHVTYEDESESWCPITVGGEFYDECEPLKINGANMGVELPKEILTAIYQNSFWNENPDESLYTRKLKEIMLNYMHIRGECGNYESALDSLKWFGYGSHMNISRLLDNDNQFTDTYVHDVFEVESDTLFSWSNFRHTTLVSIWMNSNQETDEIDWFDWNEEFVGEGKPIMEDLTKKLIYDTYDEGDIKFWRPWYIWGIDEMYLKMARVAYYWKKYFLPINTCLHSASFRTTVHLNDIKYIVKPHVDIARTDSSFSDTSVKFPGYHNIYLYNQEHYMDECYNEMSTYKELGEETEEQIVYINDICAEIPIYFEGDNDEDYYDCYLVLTREGRKVYESSFSFIQKKGKEKYNSFILIPKSLVKSYNKAYWINKNYRLAILCNGNWFYYDFVLKVPEFQLNMGTLEYKYYNASETTVLNPGDDGYIDISEIGDEAGLTDEEKAKLNVITTSKSMFTQINKIYDGTEGTEEDLKDNTNLNSILGEPWVDFNSFMYVPQLTEVNDINFFDKLKYSINAAQDMEGNTTIISQNGNTGQTMSLNSYCEYLASKCYIYNTGIKYKYATYHKKDTIIPMFMFNNGIKLANVDKEMGYKLKKFNVDVLFDVDSDNTYYAKKTFTLEDLENAQLKDWAISVDDVRNYSISDEKLAMYREDLGLIVTMGKNNTIDWANSINQNRGAGYDFANFFVDEHLTHQPNMTVRFVTTGTIETPSGREYNFGGYKKNGDPRIFTDVNIDLYNSTSACTMRCNCAFGNSISCIWKGANQDSDYQKERKDELAGGDEELQKLISANVQSAIDNLISEQCYELGIVENPKYMNRVIIYNLYVTKGNREDIKENLGVKCKPSTINQMPYDSDMHDVIWYHKNNKKYWYQQPKTVALYKMFFNNDGSTKLNLNSSQAYQYDFYLMHDEEHWFGVFISQLPIDYADNDEWLELQDIYELETEEGYKFRLKKQKSGNRFLINRMLYTEATPTHHFDNDDLIVMTLDNVQFPFILDKTTKWEVKPLSLNSNSIANIVGTSNAAIISIPDGKSGNVSGYYDVDIRYSVDGIVDHQQKKHTRILIS